MLIRRVARPMLAAAFVSQGAETLSSPMAAGHAAEPTVEGLQKLPDPVARNVPSDPETFARLTAAAQIGGGLLLATGRLPRVAAATLAATVIPANLGGHMFWNEIDPARKSRKRRDFMVDLSLLGGLIIASADTAGKPSLHWRGRRAARRLTRTSQLGLTSAGAGAAVGGVAEKVGHGLQAGAQRGRDIAGAARERLAG